MSYSIIKIIILLYQIQKQCPEKHDSSKSEQNENLKK
jgi:hypothetical protein